MFDNVEKLLKRAKTDKKLDQFLRSEKVVFFLQYCHLSHLLVYWDWIQMAMPIDRTLKNTWITFELLMKAWKKLKS